jgi:hypothetical protein
MGMRIRVRKLLVLVWGLCLLGAVEAATTVQVLETYPAGESVSLPSNRNFRMRLAYSTDTPVGIWIQPFFQGKRVAGTGTSPSMQYAGEGEAMAWFFFMKPGGEVDEIRITAGDGRTNPVVATYSVHVIGTSPSADAETPPAWVTEASARAAAAQKEAMDASMRAPIGIVTRLLIFAVGLAMLGLGLAGLALPLWLCWRWRGGWRFAAAMPVALMAFAVLRFEIEVTRDPTSHNLWPLELLLFALVSLSASAALLMARKLAGKAIRSN